MAKQTVKIKTKEGTKGVKIKVTSTGASTHTSSSDGKHGGSGSSI